MAEDGKHGKIMMREYMEEFMKYLGKMWAHARRRKCVWKKWDKIECLWVFTSVCKYFEYAKTTVIWLMMIKD